MPDKEEFSLLSQKLPDDFARAVLCGAWRVLEDKQNPIRVNLYAAAMRELFGHILRTFAPDEEVRACPWFVQAEDTPTVTRRQRAIYATQGGLSNEYVEEFGLDFGEIHGRAISTVQKLNSATHVQPGRIIEDEAEAEKFAADAIDALDELIDCFAECRACVSEMLEDDVYPALLDEFLEQTFEEIDIVAGSGYEIEGLIAVDDIVVNAITSREIRLKVDGEVPVRLHYGRGDDGAEIEHSFPFEMNLRSVVADPTRLKRVSCEIDNSGWFGA